MKFENRETTCFDKILKILIIACFTFILLFTVWGNFVSPNLGLFYETAEVYDREWIRDY